MSKKDMNISGKFVNLREITVEDAQFVLSLRCNDKKSKFLHKTEYDISLQEDYIKKYKTLDNEYYFIIENKSHKPLGTIRIYDITEDSFTGGSWLMIDGAEPWEVIEGESLMKKFGFITLGFNKCVFDVRKENKKVVRYHKLTGAKIVGENDIDYFFECYKDDYLTNIKKFLPYD